MARRDIATAKSILTNPDPVKVLWHRLFLFWESYDKEFTNLLENWHNDTAQIRRPDNGPARSTGNVLYDSFLDTWGKDKFEDNRVPLGQKSYFAALADVSIGVRAECHKVLKAILETVDGHPDVFKDPPKLKIPEQQANELAQKELSKLFTQFSKELAALGTEIDPCVETATQRLNDHYLEALLRMMQIETRCFKVQAHFLDTGMVLTEGQ